MDKQIKSLLLFAYIPASFFKLAKKLLTHISFSSTWFCYYKKYHNNDDKFFLLRSSACFQQHFHDWFSVLKYNSNLVILKWTPLLFNFKEFCDMSNRHKLFSIQVAAYASFSYWAWTPKTDLWQSNINLFPISF